MDRKAWRILGVLFLAGMVLQGCPAGRKHLGGGPPAVSLLFHGGDCGLHSEAPMGFWIGGESDLRSLGSEHEGLCEAGRSLLAEVDFEREGVLLLGLGTRPTGGYGIRLASPELEVNGDTAMIRLSLVRPAPGSRVTQALTWPCALILVPRGDYRHVQAVDGAGRLVIKTRIQ